MGNECLASTPIQHYASTFEALKVSELKDHWTTFEVFKLKKIYDQSSSNHPQYPKHTHIEQNNFIKLFSEIESFPDKQKQRFFQIFNYDGHGFVDWNNFFSMISICYFADEEVIKTLIFLIFDQSLSKELTKPELQLLINTNQSAIVCESQFEGEVPKYIPEQVAEKLLPFAAQKLTLKTWIQNCETYLSISKLRKVFSIFNEQKLEKDLVRKFNEYNVLYNQSQQRYISYLISYKWFQTWKIYIKHEYGVNLSTDNKKPVTFKTRKIFKSNKDAGTNKKIAENLKLRELKLGETKKMIKDTNSDDQYPQEIKNYDYVHSNIGEKPQEIYNNVLEGEHQQVLKHGVVEHRDYVLISQKVWKILKKIYDGTPEFRRTGFDFIELYPKILKVMKLKQGNIDYSDGTVKEVSGYYGANDVLEAIYNQQFIKNNTFYFKCIGMKKWQAITDLDYALAEISSQIVMFVLAVPHNQVDLFTKKFGKVPRDITEVNVGDFINFQNPAKKKQQTMVVMGKNIQGKYILHLPGQSYIYDICVLENDLFTKGKLVPSETVILSNGHKLPSIEQFKTKKKQETGLIGIPNVKGLGYINSVLIHLYHDYNFRQQILRRGEKEEVKDINLLDTLARIFKQLSIKKKVNTRLILETIQEEFPDFQNFSVNMCNQFINQLYRKIQNDFAAQELDIKTIQIAQSKFERSVKCLKCQSSNKEQITNYCICLPMMLSSEKYYEISYVPYCQTLRVKDIKRFGFKLPLGATMKQYKQAFEKVAGLELDEKYLLMEVYANKIIKNYSTAKNQATLEQLLLRDTDTIVAYQLQTDFSHFIDQHYARHVDYQSREIRIDQFIDCKNSTRGWVFGKVCQKDYSPYGHRIIIRVVHKFSKGQQWQISYDVDEETVANFPTRSYLNAQQFHLRLQQRYFNEASNNMQICNMPLVVVLTSWMRWRQFYYMIYLQMKKFINSQESDLIDQDQEPTNMIQSSKSIGQSRKKTNKIKLDKFKDYLYGQNFPYKINFVDYSGRCAICFKFLKTFIFPQQQQNYCLGCKLSKTEPISWQIKVSDVMVCIDWKGLNVFKKDIIKDHSSFVNMNNIRKNQIQKLENSFAMKQNGYDDMMDQLCCASQTPVTINQKIITAGDKVIFQLERIIEEDGYIKIVNKHVKFQNQIVLTKDKILYQLIGVTAIEGSSNQSTKYRTFINMGDQEWIQYDGKIVKKCKKLYIEKLCVLDLYYRRKQ